MYIFLCGANQKTMKKENVLQIQTKDLIFEVCNFSITFFQKKKDVLELVTCL